MVVAVSLAVLPIHFPWPRAVLPLKVSNIQGLLNPPASTTLILTRPMDSMPLAVGDWAKKMDPDWGATIHSLKLRLGSFFVQVLATPTLPVAGMLDSWS